MPPVEGVMVTEAIAAQPRVPLPAVIIDKRAPADLDADLVAEGAGLLSIRSVYDIMGQDQARLDQRRRRPRSRPCRIPTTARTRVASRASCASRSRCRMPDDDDIADPDNSAFGPTGVMREIVAYAPVEPDGSVRVKMPGEHRVPDFRARRQRPTLQPASTVRGCPCARAKCSSATAAIARTGRPNAAGAWPQGPVQRRVRRRRRGPLPRHRDQHRGRRRRHHGAGARAYRVLVPVGPDEPGRHRALRPRRPDSQRQRRSTTRSGASARQPTESFALHAIRTSTTAMPGERGLLPGVAVHLPHHASTTPPSAPAPATSIRCGRCRGRWPVWTPTGDGVTESPQTCTNCHNRINPVDTRRRCPRPRFELTDEVSDEDALQLRAYRHLLFARPELELVMGAVVPRQIPGPPDANGNPTTITPQLLRRWRRPMRVARGSLHVMNNATHAGMLSTAELRLLSEWLDIGAQYYNDPFPPTPQN